MVDSERSAGAEQTGGQGRYRLPLFCAVTTLFWFSLYTYVSFFTNYVESKGASHVMAGAVLASYGLTQTVLRIPLGVFSDRLRARKPFVTAGLVASTASGLGLIFADSPLMLLVLRGLAGVAAASWVVYPVLFSSYFSRARSSQAVSTIMIFLTAGNTLGMYLGGLAAHAFCPQAAFVLAALSGLTGLLLSRWTVDNFAGAHTKFSLNELLDVARQRLLLCASSMALLLQAVAFATIYGFTPVYAAGIGATRESLANLALISSIPTIAANYLSGKWFVKRIGDAATSAIGFVLMAVFTVAIPFTGTMAGLYATQMFAGFGRGMALPVLMALSIRDVSDDARGTAMGVFQAVYGIGMVLGPLVAGIVGDLANLNSSFLLMGAAALAGAGFCAVAFCARPSDCSVNTGLSR
jgi:predicted MFS family arabinose efflux permease